MRFLPVLAVSLGLCSIASVSVYAYDDPTVPATPEPSSPQPSESRIQPPQPTNKKIQPSTVAPASPSSTPKTRNGDNSRLKNGIPCIEEVCLGDNLKTLTGIPWIRGYPYPLNSPLNPKMGVTIIGDPKAIATLSQYDSSDGFIRRVGGDGIAALAKIEGFCRARRVVAGAKYLNKKGLEVEVSFGIQSSPDGSTQKLIVSSIAKKLHPGSVTGQQAQEIESQVRQKYGDAYNKRSDIEGSTQVQLLSSRTTLYLTLNMKENSSMLMKLRGCEKYSDWGI